MASEAGGSVTHGIDAPTAPVNPAEEGLVALRGSPRTMSCRPGPIPETTPVDFRQMLAEACERFEEAWRAGDQPAIEPFLEGLGPTQRATVLRELVALEVELRSERGDRPLPSEFAARFPGDATVVEAAFATTSHASNDLTDDGEGAAMPPSEGSGTVAMMSEVDETSPGTTRSAGGEVGVARGTLPRRLGRYRVLRLLGDGGFGIVYLARDCELGRNVAIKVPTARALATPARLESLLAEARLAAGLRHPAIVGVYDVGRADVGSAFIVLEYVEGMTLDDLLLKGRIVPARMAELAAGIAEAIHHAHGSGLVHRDLKPSNIMIDGRGGPRVADFGLAITDAVQPGRAGEIAGTPTHMAPEQVRGEAHRLDGRTDVWALGVILYQGLAGRLPFSGRDRATLFDGILHREPKPPRQVDDSVPGELERICLKCLSKRMTDRYASARDLAEDLRAWLVAALSQATPGLASGSRPTAAPIVPKGLRAFEREDAGFFLDLLPGPRNRDGLPESVHFWKARLEDRDRDTTFSVGLLYGPSGCGKSSLVRAGLLPQLAGGIVAVCVEASPHDTGPRILRDLRKRLPGLPAGRGLVETFAALRSGDGPKVVVILDQFEQWLHAHGGSMRSEVVDALRQCDGGRLQAVIMVRDDFAMAAARFMDALDVPIVQGHNFATLDLFDIDHARRILERFGQAFGRLPSGPPGPSAEQKRFLDAVASDLASGGKVVPVRLALFSEMIKGKPWAPATLAESGGTDGIGVRFLEETFGSRSANPRHRVHERAARDVLKALLPGVGSDIKGRTRSFSELREASGLADRPVEFADLLRVLDGELRLITPIDPSEAPADPDDDPGLKCWQLTHDYLVPSLRGWLTRGQQATRRGRAELRLEDRAALWAARPERRHLPSLPEWVGIRVLTDRVRWGPQQAEMMKRAGRLHGLRMAALGLLIASSLAGALVVRGRFERARSQTEADGLVDTLLVADVAELPKILPLLASVLVPTAPQLEAVARDPGASRKVRFRANYALADGPGQAASRLIGLAATSNSRELAAIRDRLAPYAPALKGELWDATGREEASPAALLRIGALLAIADEGGGRWRDLAPAVAIALLGMDTLDLEAWVNLLQPVAPALTPLVHDRFFDATATPAERVNAALVLARYADAPLFTELLLKADGPQFSMLFSGAPRHVEAVVEAARRALGSPGVAPLPGLVPRARNAAIALLRLGRTDEVRPHLGVADDETVRTTVILTMRDFGVRPELLLALLDAWDDSVARQALLLALETYRGRELPPATARDLEGRLARLVREGRSQAERGAAEWLLRSWGREAELAEWSRDLGRQAPPLGEVPRGRDCWATPTGHILAIVGGAAGPGMSPRAGQEDPGRPPAGPARRSALGVFEVTIQEYRQFRPGAEFAQFPPDPLFPGLQDHPRCPANKVSIVDAMRYCRWLSEQEKIPEDQMCYPPIDQIDAVDAHLSEERLSRTGYRLPTEAEWERAARAGSKTLWFFGVREEHIRHFLWCSENSRGRLHPAGMLEPNQAGFFDILGNAGEWCHREIPDWFRAGRLVSQERPYNGPAHKAGALAFLMRPYADQDLLGLIDILANPYDWWRPDLPDRLGAGPFVHRGGRYNNPAIKSGVTAYLLSTNTGYSYTGFRVARTITAGR